MANGTNIHQWDFHSDASQRWVFTHLGDGYYSIKSANSTSNYYLGVLNDGTATDTQVVLRTGSLTNGMKWKVSVTTSGSYKITPKTGEPNDRVLAVGWYAINSNGIDIKQRNYVDDDNYKDEWILSKPESSEYTIFLGIKLPTKSFSIQYSCGLIFLLFTALIVMLGVKNGIEKTGMYLMPLLFIMFILT